MSKPVIAFYDTRSYDREFFSAILKDYPFDIRFLSVHLSVDTAGMAKDCVAACVFVNDTVDKETIAALRKNKVGLVAMRCAGYNNVDLKAAYGAMHVVRVPAYSPYAVAEHAAALVLTLNRKTHRAYNRVRDGNFTLDGLLGYDLHGRTAGIIGTGRIGRCLINILKGFGMKILAYDAFADQTFAAETGVTYVDLPTIYREAQIISLHCPLTPQTRHLVNDQAFEQMRDGVMLINTGRGELLDTRALIRALKSGRVGAAGLDVYEEEGEYFFEDLSSKVVADDVLARLLTFPNVIITSHQAFFTRDAMQSIARTTLDNIQDYLNGGFLVNEICYRCDKGCLKKEKKRCF